MSKLKNGWAVGVLADIAFWGSGGTPSRTNSRYYGGQIPWIKTGELGKGLIIDTKEKLTELGLRNSSAKIFPEGSVAIAMYGATIGKVSILGIDAATNQACAVGITKEGGTTTKYLFYFLLSQKDAFTEVGKGAAQSNISQSIIKNWAIPLAPINEQKRIADKLDTLLARVEACRARLDRVHVILKRFRQAVLAEAMSGRLTEDWREEPKDSWTTVSVQEVADAIFDGPFGSNLKSKDYTDTGVRVVRLENIGHLHFFGKKISYVSAEKYKSLQKHTLNSNDVLFSSFINQEIRVCLLPRGIGTAINKADCFCIRVSPSRCLPEFLVLCLAANSTYKTLLDLVHGATRPRINLKQLKQFKFKMPSLEEQNEIVRRVEVLFAYADRLAKHTQAAYTEVEHLTPALLDKAFRGELVPQDPNDEPASVLLERIRAERAMQPDKPKRTRRTKRSKMTKNSVKKAILELPQDHFLFDELRHNLAGSYDKLKDIIFALLNETEPSMTQLFDETLETMLLVRSNK